MAFNQGFINLSDIDVTLGVVIESVDPEKMGRIKVGGAGLWDRAVMKIDSIPWVYPLCMHGYQTYSRMQDGSKVWVFKNKRNLEELYYLPYHDMNPDTHQAQNDDIESDVLFSRNVIGKLVQLYQNKTEGIVLRVGDAKISIMHNGQIRAISGNAHFKIEGNQCYVGNPDGDYEPMVRGQQLYNILDTLAKNLKSLAVASMEGGGYTMPLQKPFQTASDDINKVLPKLLSTSASVAS